MAMLVAAVCFALLAGLHAARPISGGPDFALAGFSPADICGYSEDASSGSCPNCVLAKAAVEPALPTEAKRTASVARKALPPAQAPAPVAAANGLPPARGPPLFT
ncbi:hypothetical protein PSA7680_03369 [Pseudoruegeria aquimaris]|uniref:Uncharacterized protein n=1 Tax=Pseudoruegeria aquimaris TaxID=393663 RepID=A0A1Y5TJW5_9RHOB|nr:hypothetical protein [Pseudoruegeria aquimaris]SLN63672.1 hypothetical protein PSA7680_03369 [Pseudoruegeria aquimaris]